MDMPRPGQVAGVNQAIAVAQQANERTASDALHDVLLKEENAPDCHS
ncbi:hypothetical protein LOD26_24340 [Citrobacter sp. BR102]|uniref:Uncharacterized protein n=1 Tax=Citrobacter meridianamericanus TaxID=2894201 RepID=A0ABT1BEX2_9ENTR|nr:hypothetical protein [Citrobacter meridianamericanus]MCO5784412.1 hypothetical protein [Citrobacter meridianamericanus]